MEQKYKTIFQFKRGPSKEWTANNPILREGEPGLDTDTFILKIGDGVTPWSQLKILGENSVLIKSTKLDFPEIGKDNFLYITTVDNKLYRWDNDLKDYIEINSHNIVSSDEMNKIKILEDNTLEINSISIKKLENDGTVLVLNGGTSLTI